MPKLNLFFALKKVDEAQRLVYGIATAEQVDRAGEICDYEGTKPYYKAWSDDMHKASGGKSYGNVREMHDNKAAGKLFQAPVFNDELRQIEICAKVVDEEAWNKVLEGVYTGFSQGGSYVKSWKDPDDKTITRYIADPAEVSLVDMPCLASATFELIRANGATEMRKFDTDKIAKNKLEQKWVTTDGEKFEKVAAAAEHQAKIDAEALSKPTREAIEAITKRLDDVEGPMYWEEDEYLKAICNGNLEAGYDEVEKKDFSDKKREQMASEGKAMKDGSYPIETKGDLANAIRAIGRAKDPEKTKKHIIARAKALAATSMLPTDWEGSTKKTIAPPRLKKGLPEVARIACMLQDLKWLHQNLVWERDVEEDESPNPDHLEEIIKEMCEFLCNLADEECKELVGGDDMEEVMEMAAGLNADAASALVKSITIKSDNITKLVEELEKSGARHSKADAGKLDEMKEHAEEMGDHVDKMMKIHKAMSDTHEGDNGGHAERKEEMKEHLGKMMKCATKMQKCHGTMMETMKGLGAADKVANSEDMMKLQAANSALTETIESTNGLVKKLEERIATIENQPGPSKVSKFIVNKDSEHVTGEEDRATESSNARAVMPATTSPEMFRNRQSIR